MSLQSLLSKCVAFYKLLGLYLIIAISITACDGSKVQLVDVADQDAANEIVLLLGNNGIDTNIQQQKGGRIIVFVDKDKQNKALNLLNANGMPHNTYSNFGEVFKKDSFISSPLEEHSRFLYALDQEIASMLSVINGVVDVKTIVNVPAPNDNLWQTTPPQPTASVIIKYRQGERIDLYVNRIKNLVSNAVPGLTPDRVEVVMLLQKDN